MKRIILNIPQKMMDDFPISVLKDTSMEKDKYPETLKYPTTMADGFIIPVLKNAAMKIKQISC